MPHMLASNWKGISPQILRTRFRLFSNVMGIVEKILKEKNKCMRL